MADEGIKVEYRGHGATIYHDSAHDLYVGFNDSGFSFSGKSFAEAEREWRHMVDIDEWRPWNKNE